MNDLFYFSSEEVSLRDIHDLLVEKLPNKLFLTANSDGLQIDRGIGVGFWDIFSMDVCQDFEDPDSRHALSETGTRSAFCISHHSHTLSELKIVLKTILERFGGWVGNDSDGFRPRFSIENIASLSYR